MILYSTFRIAKVRHKSSTSLSNSIISQSVTQAPVVFNQVIEAIAQEQTDAIA